MPDWAIIMIVLMMWLHGFLLGWAFAHDGKSPFWTELCDVLKLRILRR